MNIKIISPKDMELSLEDRAYQVIDKFQNVLKQQPKGLGTYEITIPKPDGFDVWVGAKIECLYKAAGWSYAYWCFHGDHNIKLKLHR